MWLSVILSTTRRCSGCAMQYPLRELIGITYCNWDLHYWAIISFLQEVLIDTEVRWCWDRKFRPAPGGCLMSTLCLNFQWMSIRVLLVCFGFLRSKALWGWEVTLWIATCAVALMWNICLTLSQIAMESIWNPSTLWFKCFLCVFRYQSL